MEENRNKLSVYFESGCRYMELNEFQKAIIEFDKLISLAPSVDVIKRKYECLTKLGAYQSKKEKILFTHSPKKNIDAKKLTLEKNKDDDKNLLKENQSLLSSKKVKGKYLGVVNDKLSKKYSKDQIAIACGYFEIKNKIKVPLVKEYLDESFKSKEELVKLKNHYSVDDYHLKYIELDIFKGRLCEYDGEEHGEFVYVPKRIIENSKDWDYQIKDFENFDMEYVENEDGLEDFESYIGEKFSGEELKSLNMEKEFLKFYDFCEPMMIKYVSMMFYVDHYLKNNYERLEHEDIAEAHGIRYEDIHEKSFF